MIINGFEKSENYLTLILSVVFFCYAICLAFIFQNVIVPNMPSMSDGGKLLLGDAIYFDGVAWSLAEEIRSQGWGQWRLFVNTAATGNVAILGAIYAVFGHDPSFSIPINACLHAFGGLLIFLLARELASKKVIGTYAGVIAGTLFILFPSALNWYGQIHKDGYAIAGTLLILLMWIKVINRPTDNFAWIKLTLGSIVGVCLVGMVRPYSLMLLLVVAVGAMLIIISTFKKNEAKDVYKQVVFIIFTLVLLIVGVEITKEHASQVNIDYQFQTQVASGWRWENSDWLPDEVENYIKAAAKTRATLIHYGETVNAGSTIDKDVVPQNIIEVIEYLPRALQVSSLAPFPTTWFSQISMTRMVAAGEMFLYYLCIPGIFLFLRYNRKPSTWMAIYFSTTFLMILGFTIANMGTLFRVRYAYLFILLLVGVLGWLTYLDRKGILIKITQFLRPQTNLPLNSMLSAEIAKSNRKQAVSSSIYVMALTFIGFIGFFYRDILMAQAFGVTTDLDIFFIALLIPMTIVTIFCIPLGVVFTPIFVTAKETMSKKEVQALISTISGIVVTVLAVLCFVLYFAVPSLLPYVVFGTVIEDMTKIRELTVLALPILFFSGSVILGNAVLNASGKFVVASTAQLIVPLVAILAVVNYGDNYSVNAVIIGMIVGQQINLLVVQINMKKLGYSLAPRFNIQNKLDFNYLSSQYFPLIIAAFFVSIAVLVNTLLAMSLPEGSVSVFNLGNKFVLLVTGLIGASISTVMLPYFSVLVAKKHIMTARNELSAFLLWLTFLSIPISVALFVWSEPLVRFIFEGESIGNSDVINVARVLKYAVIQIPFFACNVLLLKYASATKHVMAILLVAVLGLLINIAASLLFMQHMGVAGIALGASVSMMLATIFLVMILARYRHVSLFDVVVLLLNWLLFITLLVSIHFGSAPGIVVTIVTYFILLSGYIKSQFNQSQSGDIATVMKVS